MKQKLLVWAFFAMCLLFFVSVLFNPITLTYLATAESKISSCDGIDYYFSNSSFWVDKDEVIMRGNQCNGDETLFSQFLWYKPSDMRNCTTEGIDCEDISHFLMCLARKYNKTCRIYVTMSYPKPGHQGIDCYSNGGWREVF